MEFNLDLRDYSENIINGHISKPVRVIRMWDSYFGLDFITDEGFFTAHVNEQLLNELNLSSPIVEVHPIITKNTDLIRKKTKLFKLERKDTHIYSSRENPLTGQVSLVESIGAPYSWFREEEIDYDKVDAILISTKYSLSI